METKITNTTPSTNAEAKTPATTAAATTTPAPEQITATTPPAPAMTTATTTAPASTTTTPASAKPGAGLPANYCADGRLTDAEGVIRPEYIGETAEALAKGIRPLAASAFYTAFLKSCKDLRKKKVSYTAQKNAALGMVTQAKKLVYRKRDPAPAVLVDMIEAATATVKDPATFEALYMHLDAVYSCLLMMD